MRAAPAPRRSARPSANAEILNRRPLSAGDLGESPGAGAGAAAAGAAGGGGGVDVDGATRRTGVAAWRSRSAFFRASLMRLMGKALPESGKVWRMRGGGKPVSRKTTGWAEGLKAERSAG